MVSDAETSDCDSLATSPSTSIDLKVAAAYTRGPERVVLRGATYLSRPAMSAECERVFSSAKADHRGIRMLEELVGSRADKAVRV
jgi:hypothetical protein